VATVAIASTYYTYPWRDGQAELVWVARWSNQHSVDMGIFCDLCCFQCVTCCVDVVNICMNCSFTHTDRQIDTRQLLTVYSIVVMMTC